MVFDSLAAVEDPNRPTELEAGGPNSIAILLGTIGDEWNLQILRFALLGSTRYAEFRERMAISHSVLSGRLAWLTRMGLFARLPYQQRPERFEYVLTARGRGTWSLLTAVWMWEARWVSHHDEELPVMRHVGCPGLVELDLACTACLDVVTARDIKGEFGPSGTWQRSVPAGTTRRRSQNTPDGQFPSTMSILGNRWSSAIVGALFQGVGRFKDFETVLQAPPTVISDRLRTLTEFGVIATSPSAQRADWYDYRLTEKGLAFYPVVAFAFDWAHHWFIAPEGDAFEAIHRACKARFVPCFTCATCGERADPDDLAVTPAGVARDAGGPIQTPKKETS